MISVIHTIVPVFLVILLGALLRSRGFFPPHFLEPLNRMVYYLAIPAMIFQTVAAAGFEAYFHPLLLTGTLIPVPAVFLISLALGRLFSIPRPESGTFLQSSFHGNLGYIGLAVAYYLLGKEGFTLSSILAPFLLLLQNILAVLGLQAFSQRDENQTSPLFFLKKVAVNPVILSALGGILFSLCGIPLPTPINRTFDIISGMALPLALLVIGASLSFGLMKSYLAVSLGAGFLKLLILPGLGFCTYHWLGISPALFTPGMILLASPTATVTYVMAGEMKGSTPLASAAISITTLLSFLTFIFWLSLLD